MKRRARALTLAALTALALTACSVDVADVADGSVDAGTLDAPLDGGALGSLALDAAAPPTEGVDAGAPLLADAHAFRFVRLRSPTVGGDEIVRIGLAQRVRLVDGVPEERSAPSAESLAVLTELCADGDVAAALATTAPQTSVAATIELACAPLTGTLVCEGTCGDAFDRVRTAVTAAWREDIASPEEGVDVRATSWTAGRVAPIAVNVVASVNGKELLPAKGRPFGRIERGQMATLCPPAGPCVDVVAPALVHLDVFDAQALARRVATRGAPTLRWRCATCSPAGRSIAHRDDAIDGKVTAQPRLLKSTGGELSREEIRAVVDSRIGELQSCYEKHLRTQSDLAGRVVLAWTVNLQGKVTVVKIAQSTLASADASNCMMTKLKAWRFPKPRGAPVAIVFPFVFHTL